MLARLAGLMSAKKQRAQGWPNLAKATEMRRHNAERRRPRREFERRAAEQALSHAERENRWRELIRPEPSSVRGIKPVDLRARGMPLLQARRAGLTSGSTQRHRPCLAHCAKGTESASILEHLTALAIQLFRSRATIRLSAAQEKQE
jgi:protein tyrosine/serine phosphatase